MKASAFRSLVLVAMGLSLSASSCTGSTVSDRDWEVARDSEEQFRAAPDQSRCGHTVWVTSAELSDAWMPVCEMNHKSGIRSTLYGKPVFGSAAKGWSFNSGELEFGASGTFSLDIPHPQSSRTPSVEYWTAGMAADSRE